MDNESTKSTPSNKLAIIHVLAALIQNPLLFADNKYRFSIKDFPEGFHQIVYGAIEHLALNGMEKIGYIDIDQFLKQYTVQYKVFCANRGVEYIQNALAMYDPKKFDYYYQTLKKYSLINNLTAKGIDTRDIFDPEIIDPVASAKMYEKFDNYTVDDILLAEETKVILAKEEFGSSSDRVENKAGDGLRALKERFKETPDMGLPLISPKLTTIFRGQRRGCLFIESAPSGCGKALPNTSKLPTPNGWKTVGEIKVGDYLFDGFGKPTMVTDIFPQGKKEVYKVTFRDGRTVRCCDEHLWSYCTDGQKDYSKENRKFYTKTLREIIDTVPLKTKDGTLNVLIPQQKAVEYSEKKHDVSPYKFGLMLDLNYIPQEYLQDTVKNRWDLLKGLLRMNKDIDFYKDEMIYSASSLSLRDSVIELAHSLGIQTYSFKNQDKNLSSCYQIIFTGILNSCSFNPIIAIEDLNYQEEMTCFMVNNEEHLFLTDDFVVTHNSRRGNGEACHLAIPEYYDVQKQEWIRTNMQESVLMISTELEEFECQQMWMAFVAGVSEAHIKDGRYAPGEEERVDKAIDLIEKSNLYFISITNYDTEDIINIIKKYKQLYDVNYVFFDYLGETSKITSSASKQAKVQNLRTDQILLMLASALKDAAKTLGIYIWTASQLAGDYKNAKDLDAAYISAAKSISFKVDVGSILMPVREMDQPIIDSYCAKGFELAPNFVISVYKVRAGSYQSIKLYTYFDRSTCQMTDCFVTNSRGELLPIEDTNIEIILDNTKEEKFENAYSVDANGEVIDFDF